jgi:hypothetical protein
MHIRDFRIFQNIAAVKQALSAIRRTLKDIFYYKKREERGERGGETRERGWGLGA